VHEFRRLDRRFRSFPGADRFEIGTAPAGPMAVDRARCWPCISFSAGGARGRLAPPEQPISLRRNRPEAR
jgi:hypothetical protein